MAAASEWKETIMRCMDFRGLKLFRCDMEEMCSRMVARDAGWNILGLSSRVMRSVFDGGAGDDNGGRDDKSMERGDRDRFLDIEEGDAGGEEDCISDCRGEGCGCSREAIVISLHGSGCDQCGGRTSSF